MSDYQVGYQMYQTQQTQPRYVSHLSPPQNQFFAPQNQMYSQHPQYQDSQNYRFSNHNPPQPVPHHLLPNGRTVVETKYLLTRSGPLGTSGQATAAASFFARNHKLTQQVPLQPLDRHHSESSAVSYTHLTLPTKA